MEKKIGVIPLTAMIVGNMIGSGIFLLPTSLARLGSITLISWVITALGALVLGFLFSRMSQLLPREGGPYAYVREGLGNPLGFQTALSYWIFFLGWQYCDRHFCRRIFVCLLTYFNAADLCSFGGDWLCLVFYVYQSFRSA